MIMDSRNYTDDFFKYLRYERRMSPHTLTSYRNDLSQFEQFLAEHYAGASLLTVEFDMVRAWILELLESGLTVRTVVRRLSALRAFYRYLVKVQLLSHSPMELVHAPKMPKRLPQFVNENEMAHLFNDALFADNYEGWRDRLILELFYATGMRLSELQQLTFAHVDLNEFQIKVTGKRNKQRIIPFSARLRMVIENYCEFFEKKFGNINKKYCIFVGSKQDPMEPLSAKSIYRIVRKYLDMVTTIEQRSPHVIRHTFATHLLNHGADLNAIKEVLGHASLAATQVYTHNSIEKLKKIYNQAHPRA